MEWHDFILWKYFWYKFTEFMSWVHWLFYPFSSLLMRFPTSNDSTELFIFRKDGRDKSSEEKIKRRKVQNLRVSTLPAPQRLLLRGGAPWWGRGGGGRRAAVLRWPIVSRPDCRCGQKRFIFSSHFLKLFLMTKQTSFFVLVLTRQTNFCGCDMAVPLL